MNCQSVSFLKWLFQQYKLDSDHATDTIRSPPGLTVNPQLPENVTPTSVKRNKRPGILQAMKKIWSKKRFQVSCCMPYSSCLACWLITDWEFEFDPYVCGFCHSVSSVWGRLDPIPSFRAVSAHSHSCAPPFSCKQTAPIWLIAWGWLQLNRWMSTAHHILMHSGLL